MKQNVQVSISFHKPASPKERAKRRAKLNLRPLGNPEATCPYCSQHLKKKPGRKKKCPHCGQFIYIRTRPSDEKQVLVTESQAEEIEEQWSIVNGTHEEYLAARQEFENERASLRQRFGCEPSENDVKWGLLNKALIAHSSHQNWGLFRNTKLDMGELLRKEDKFMEALGIYLEVCYLDLNGPKNMGGITDRSLLREFPSWDLKSSTADLAPGVLGLATQTIQKSNIDKSKVEKIFMKRTNVLYTSLHLPLSPANAWQQIKQELFEE